MRFTRRTLAILHMYYVPMALTHRTHVLLDERRHRMLHKRADREGVSVGALIRDAIDRSIVDEGVERRAAFESLMAAEPMYVGDIDELEEELASEIEEEMDELDREVGPRPASEASR